MSSVLVSSRVRAGGKFLAFTVVAVLLMIGHNAALHQIPALAAALDRLDDGQIPLWLTFVTVGTALLLVVGLTWLAARLERRSLADYGLPLRSAFGRRFWQGALWGLVMMTLVLAVTWALGGISFAAPSLGLASAAFYAAGWALSTALIALSEELLFRGYALKTLGKAIGFWPAAGLLAVLFGALHLSNPNENLVGGLNVVAYALLVSLSLRRTGNLWFAIGIHAAWNYASSVLYGVPVSGMQAEGHLLQADLHGPSWLTGGKVGPEGSVLGFAAVVIACAVFAWRYPARPVTAATAPAAAPASSAPAAA